MGKPVRFAWCMVGLLGLMLAAFVPVQPTAASPFGKAMGPIPRGLPGPEEIQFPTRFAPGTIVVVAAHKRLYFVTSRGRALRYVVGVGRDGMNWKGTAEIARKAEWPRWTPPAEMHARARAKGKFLPQQLDGGPNNPLGARALYLYKNGKDTLYRIHGTNEPHNLGKAVTAGCIRMLNHHVADLYNRVRIGTTVIVM
jgi:lipoprotein-anchoring transpeptidase ErfK/SrfK